MSRAIRLLVLACSLVFVLPQGWCCVLPSQIATGATVTQPGKCCECRKHHKPAKPTEKPFEVPADRCPCADRHTVLANSLEKSNPELDCVAILPAPEQLPHCYVTEREEFITPHPVAYRLHVFKCVWRC